jgi:hypothetical protein
MPIYDVLEVSFGSIPTCVLSVTDGEGRVYQLEVKGNLDLTPLKGKRIRLATTNREVIPTDIVVDSLATATAKDMTVPEPPNYSEAGKMTEQPARRPPPPPRSQMRIRDPNVALRPVPGTTPEEIQKMKDSGVQILTADEAKRMGIDKLIEERRRKQSEVKSASSDAPVSG